MLFIYSASEHPFTLQSIVTALHIVSGISHVFICFKKISLNFQTILLSCAVYTSGTFQVHCRQPLQTLCLLFISNGKCKIITTYILSPQPAKKNDTRCEHRSPSVLFLLYNDQCIKCTCSRSSKTFSNIVVKANSEMQFPNSSQCL